MKRPPLYVLPGSHPGLLIRGNIDINHRPSVPNPKGGTSSVFSASFRTWVDGRWVEVLVPQVINTGSGFRIVSGRQAFLNFQRTGQHLGIFDTSLHANAYAHKLHLQQARLGGS